jgi:hypothetical protein
MVAPRCPQCGGEAARPIAPGFWECVATVEQTPIRHFTRRDEETGLSLQEYAEDEEWVDRPQGLGIVRSWLDSR